MGIRLPQFLTQGSWMGLSGARLGSSNLGSGTESHYWETAPTCPRPAVIRGADAERRKDDSASSLSRAFKGREMRLSKARM
jgi:hypothetical protein